MGRDAGDGDGRPRRPLDIWYSLLLFGDREGMIAILDWQESPAEVVKRLRDLSSAGDVVVDWPAYESLECDTAALLRHVGADAKRSGQMLVSLETGNDEYAVRFITPKRAIKLSSLAMSALGQQVVVVL